MRWLVATSARTGRAAVQDEAQAWIVAVFQNRVIRDPYVDSADAARDAAPDAFGASEAAPATPTAAREARGGDARKPDRSSTQTG